MRGASWIAARGTGTRRRSQPRGTMPTAARGAARPGRSPARLCNNPGMPASKTAEILQRTLSGGRLSFPEAVTLLEEGNLLELGAAADEVRRRHNDPGVATYIVDRNINYTNVCVYRCQFCAFYRPSAAHPEAYVLTFDQIGEKIQETIDLGGTGVLLQGGVDGDLPFSFYEDMFRFIRKN